MEQLSDLVARARSGDLDAFGRLVQAMQVMIHAVALGILRDPDLAQDAAQEAYLRAFRGLADLEEPKAFLTWLRRIVITVASNMRQGRRATLLRLEDVPVVPVLDEVETTWSEAQRQRLARALLTLTGPERRLCDLRYHGHWSTARLAKDAGVDEAVMRKRLQRIRDKLRKEMEMAEQRDVRPEDLRTDLPAKVVELLTRPRLTDIPENPVGRILELLRGIYTDFARQKVGLNPLESVDRFLNSSRVSGSHNRRFAAAEALKKGFGLPGYTICSSLTLHEWWPATRARMRR